MLSGGDESPPPQPAPPAAASSEAGEPRGEARDPAPPAQSPIVQTQKRFRELCSSVSLDEAAQTQAWENYQRMNESYTLEGNDLHWLACAIYVASRKPIQTVGKGVIEGSTVSLTKLLRRSQQSLFEFFNKIKKWEEMANLAQSFREHTERLERNFTVSAVVFKKYEMIFQDLFKNPQEDQPRQQRGRKQRRLPCTASEVFQFSWVLFIYAKGNFPMISDDLVNSYHLLLCVLDLIYGNALQCPNRRELMNPGFKGLPEDFHSKDFKPASDLPCVMEQLCSLREGIVLEAKGIKEHFWKPYIRKLFEKKLLKGKEENLTGLLDPVYFGDNFKAITNAYEASVFCNGNLDERIFLGEDAEEDIGTVPRSLNIGADAETASRAQMRSILQHGFSRPRASVVTTPLTGVRYLRDSSPRATPSSAVTHSLARLHTMLAGLKNAPSSRLEELLRACARDPTQAIVKRVEEMSEIYSRHPPPDEEFGETGKELASKYFRFAETLYYKLLESLIEQEKRRLGNQDLSVILEQDAFHRSLLACCLDVVIFSHDPPGNFPFVVEIFELPHYHFYKVIELFIRAEDNLCREMVKHLNEIEEQILDHLAWKSGSLLWEMIKDNENKVPTCEEVIPPNCMERPDEVSAAVPSLATGRAGEARANTGGLGKPPPTPKSARRRLFADNDSPTERGTLGRVPPQPLVTAVPVQGMSGEAGAVAPVPAPTLVTLATATVKANSGHTMTIPIPETLGIANDGGRITFFPLQVNVGGQAQAVTSPIQPICAQALAGGLRSQQVTGTAVQVSGQVAIQPTAAAGGQQQRPGAPSTSSGGRTRKISSLSLFFRKVYYLAAVRLRDLCTKLDIAHELRRKIWTCFEFSLIQCPELMMDRHLDQLLMCAIYVMAKVTKEDKSFQNIMRSYRSQPQARSQVYRSVLIKGTMKRSDSGSGDSPTELKDRSSPDPSVLMRSNSTLPVPQPGSAPPTPTKLTGANSEVEEEERGDLIQFYNNIYIKQVQSFAMKFSQPNAADTPPLTPYPSVRAGFPRRVLLSQNYAIYISPYSGETVLSPGERMLYYFSDSPPKRLKEINSMVRTGETPPKKRGIVAEDKGESPAKRVCAENQSALIRRLQDVATDRGT